MQEITNKEVEKFYNEFVPAHIDSGINERVWLLFNRIKKMGLTSTTRILELGCGIGTLTSLLSKKIKNGYIESVDLSSGSITLLKSKINNKCLQAFADDVVHYQPKQNNFDYITLFDVIEHIPEQLHEILFENIANYMSPTTKLLINIPNPEYIAYDRKYQAHVLQVIDQSIYLKNLLPIFTKNNLQLSFFESYSIWVKNDYHFLKVEKINDFKEVKMSSVRTFKEKVLFKCRHFYLKIFKKY